MQQSNRIILLAGLVSCAGLAQADITNGPDPYAPGYGFVLPEEAGWGWSRGDAGSLYAEWDTFSDASYGTASDRTAAPDAGSSGTTDAYFSWNSGTFAAGTGNLYNFTGPESFQAYLAGPTSTGETLRVALQIEEWGTPVDTSSVLLNGAAPSYSAVTYTDPAFPSSFGEVTLTQRLFYWDLTEVPADFQLAFGTTEPHLSLAQVAVDVGSVAAVPVPAAVWLLGSALAGMGIVGRRGNRGGQRELLA